MTTKDIYIFSEENLLEQLKSSKYKLGFCKVRFYTDGKQLAESKTENISDFYLYPSGGTLRDENMNIVFYNAKFDTYRGFNLPQNNNPDNL